MSTTQTFKRSNKIHEKKPEAASRDVLQEKVFLEVSQNSQESTCARDSGRRDSRTGVFL